MFFLLPLIGVAVGAVVGGLATHAAGEGDRRSAKHQRDIANDLITKHTKLEQRYSEYTDESKNQVAKLTQQHASDEVEKDLLRLAVRLQQGVYTLMWAIDDRPTPRALADLEKAVLATNQVLSQLSEPLIQVPGKYLSRNRTRLKSRRFNRKNLSRQNFKSLNV